MPEQVRHGRQQTPSRASLLLKSIAVAAAVVLVSGIGVAAYAYNDITSQISDAAVDIGGDATMQPAPFLGAIDGGFNMLVVGTDNDANQGDSFGERDATLNDVNILVHVSPDHQNAVVVSFPRDLVIDQPSCNDSGEVYDQPLNTSWERGGDGGGLACVAATIRELTGLDIPYAAATSFNGVIEMTNAVGGVQVCATAPIEDPDSGLYIPKGYSTVEGAEALAFLRNRHGVGDGSDLARIGSQQQYLSSLLRKIRDSSTLSDPTKVYGLAQAAAQNITPSTSLKSPDALVSLALSLKDIDLSKVVFVSYPVSAYVEDPNKVQPVQDLADELFARIASDQPFTLDADSTATGSSQDPSAGSTPPAPEPTATPGAPDATDAPTDSAATPDVIEGLKGQTAAEQTCANPFDG
ncbi:LytR family transcriptional regulator [Humibacter sp. BT305]|nr:LytR family transcriptional regulator [Humibacter sp. BT305]